MPDKQHASPDPWIEFGKMVADQLSMQVELSFERHHMFLMNHGLEQCRRVADIGTGNAKFLMKLAAAHPAIRFTGVDDEAVMIDAATSHGIINADFMLADARDERVIKFLGAVDGILMRYFVLHLHDTGRALPDILSAARPGTALWIFDLDKDFTRCDPPDESFTLFRQLVDTFCARHNTEIRLSSIMPSILESAGFQIRAVKEEPFNNREIDPAVMADYLYREALLYHHFLYGNHESDMLQEIRSFLFKQLARNDRFVQYGMAMIAAEKR